MLKKKVWEPRSHAFPPHYTTEISQNRTLTPNIAQMRSQAKSSFSSCNPLRQAVYLLRNGLQTSRLITGETKSKKSQKFSVFFKVSETSTNQILRSYHEQFPGY